MATADFSVAASDNATVQAGGPRSGNNGKIFFNIQGSGNGGFASFGVADFDLSAIAPGFEVVDLLDIGTLDIVESNAGFTTNGAYSVYFTDAVDVSIQPGSPVNYQGGDGVASIDPLLTNLSLLGSFNFVENSDGSVDTVNLTFTDAAEAYIIEQINDADTDDTLRLVFASDDPNVAATYAGQDNFDGSAPTLNFTVADGDGSTPTLLINEIDADTPTAPVNDALEFVELFDGGVGNTSLDGFTVVFFNGNGDASYQAFDLDGFTTDADGFFVLGNPDVANVDLTFGPNTLQNGADAVAIYQGDASDFPNGTAVTTENLVDAVVYDTNDSDDAGLLPLLNAGQPQVNEGSGPNGSANDSLQRIPNGAGGARNTETFRALPPTPGAANEDNTGGPERLAIFEIQGAGQVSESVGDQVITTGIVTAVGTFDNATGTNPRDPESGFFIQDPNGDGNDATSDAIFIASSADVSMGDAVEITGVVRESAARSRELTYTRIEASEITVESSGNELPEAVILGQGGRVPPSETIEDDDFTSFDPDTDGIDFFESIEGMRVTAQNFLATSNTNGFGEIFGVVDNGADATGISDRGTLNISPDDFNPEKVQIDVNESLTPGFSIPSVDTGAQLGDVTGVVTYGFGNFEIQPTEEFSVTTPSTLQPETTQVEGSSDQLTVATYNVLNLDPIVEDISRVSGNQARNIDDDIGDGCFTAIAEQIVNNLSTPDIIGLQEVQDNTGAEINDGVTSASETLQR